MESTESGPSNCTLPARAAKERREAMRQSNCNGSIGRETTQERERQGGWLEAKTTTATTAEAASNPLLLLLLLKLLWIVASDQLVVHVKVFLSC